MGLRTEMVKRWPALAPLLGKDAERIRRRMARAPELIAHNLSMLSYEVGERSLKADVTWYRGEHCNFLPDRKALSEPDALARYLGQGWLPARPFITKTDPITTFGSCFAEHISAYLRRNGYTTADLGRNRTARIGATSARKSFQPPWSSSRAATSCVDAGSDRHRPPPRGAS